MNTSSVSNGQPALQIEVQDNGAGFTPEAVQKGSAPFSPRAMSVWGLA